ncbi:hypothetical protein [Breoghania sp. L-A4]|uniref:hypothetical protein n=1 Tax=Breoghania sp. L-A4 TaxID=2304600 RepID=UPI0013C2B348|nr:hypothetical protein [Breoghania sp. L-A4]
MDLVHLARHTLGNRDLEQEVLRLFIRQSVVFLDKMKGATNHEQRACAAHTIKGSAAVLVPGRSRNARKPSKGLIQGSRWLRWKARSTKPIPTSRLFWTEYLFRPAPEAALRKATATVSTALRHGSGQLRA